MLQSPFVIVIGVEIFLQSTEICFECFNLKNILIVLILKQCFNVLTLKQCFDCFNLKTMF